MDIDFLNLANFFHPALFVKIITLIILGFYVVFAFVVFTQVRVMGKLVELPHAEAILKTLAIINLIAAIMLFVIAVVIL